MPYTAEISRQNPGCFLFLIDQSGSMADAFGGEPGRSKADRLADAVNRLIYELTIRCTKDQSEGVRNYYEIGVIGYGGRTGPAWVGSLSGKTLVPLREVADNPARLEERRRKVEDGAGGFVEEAFKLPVWFEPVADDGTPMCQAFAAARSILEPWVGAHPTSSPPIVINITDGEATDGDIRAASDPLRRLSTYDGDVLLFNIHVSSKPGSPILYSETEAALPDEFSRLLFQISSILPPHIQEAAKNEGYAVGPQSRGFVFNAEMVEVIRFLDIGTRPKGLR
jgi:hypothetical protein